MRTLVLICITALLIVAGCPQQGNNTLPPAVTARITASTSLGPVPLTVTFSGAASTSTNAGALEFAWDFGGDGTGSGQSPTHTFSSPGLYTVVLTVTDAAEDQGLTSVDVRVQGEEPVAVIQADTNSGPVPLLVYFDGEGSYADDDAIRDYTWDFGDGGDVVRRPAPSHYFEQAGEFTVTLTVTTGGGVSSSTTTVITVGGNAHSLQFDGSQFATLPLVQPVTLATCTFETWFKAGAAGGTLVSVGSGAMTIELRPQDNLIRFQIAGEQYEASATNLSGLWRHVALSYDSAQGAALYLDGVAVTSSPDGTEIEAAQVTLGMGFAGKLAKARLWSSARSAEEIASNYDQQLGTVGADVLGYWRLDEGSGQTLINRAGITLPGMLGASDATEWSDPAWSTDSPPVD
ncbi:MAG: PKD domain-containing protein [Planctomycetota bacterium]